MRWCSVFPSIMFPVFLCICSVVACFVLSSLSYNVHEVTQCGALSSSENRVKAAFHLCALISCFTCLIGHKAGGSFRTFLIKN